MPGLHPHNPKINYQLAPNATNNRTTEKCVVFAPPGYRVCCRPPTRRNQVIRRWMKASLISAGLLAFAVASAPAQEASGRIAGTVTDAESGRPLAGAQVYLDGTTVGVLTSSEGRYTLANVRP